MATQAELDAHITDATDAHDASAISVADAGGLLAATVVEAALAEILGKRVVVRKSADESVTSSTVLQDDDHLLFAIGANEIWAVQLVLFCDGATAGDIQATLVGPAGATGALGLTGPGRTATSQTSATVDNTGVALGVAPGTGLVGAGSTSMLLLNGVVVNGATPGNVVLQWAQIVSSGTATRVLANSFLVAHRIA